MFCWYLEKTNVSTDSTEKCLGYCANMFMSSFVFVFSLLLVLVKVSILLKVFNVLKVVYVPTSLFE